MTLPRPLRLLLLIAPLVLLVVGLALFGPRPAKQGAPVIMDKPVIIRTEIQVHTGTESRVTTILAEERLSDKKREFLQTLLAPVLRENLRIENKRERLQSISAAYLKDGDISEADFNWIKALANEYQLKPQRRSDSHFFTDLLTRVDTIPPSLALAQAALESGWGTSRYAQSANNFYGHTCRESFCGVDATHSSDPEGTQFRAFLSEEHSVEQYMRNLNTHAAYADLRKLRTELRARGEKPTGLALAPGLEKYSVLGPGYVEEVERMIRSNNFDALD